MIAKKDAYIEKAYQHLQVISQDKEKRLEYETREKAIRDYNFLIKKSKEEGLEEGRIEGKREGRIEGEREEKFKIAKNMLLKNLDISVIVQCTGLSEEEVKTLKEI